MSGNWIYTRPYLYLSNGRWYVYTTWAPVHGYLLMESAYAYAKAVWERGKKRE